MEAQEGSAQPLLDHLVVMLNGDSLRCIPESSSELDSAVKEGKSFLIGWDRAIRGIGHAHESKAQSWHLWPVLAECS